MRTNDVPSYGFASPPSSETPEAQAPGPRVPELGQEWRRFQQELRTPASERAMAAFLRDFAARDPDAALKLALAEGNLLLREKFRGAALQGWAALAPDEAAAWALALPAKERSVAFREVLTALTGQPERAVNLALQASAKDPAQARDYGSALVGVLTEAGAYETAARFALAQPTQQADLVGSAYYEWAQHQPAQALAALDQIGDAKAREDAFRGLMLGWSTVGPAEVAAYAADLPPGPERSGALNEALPRWIVSDPDAAAAWLGGFEPNRDFDDGWMALATSPEVLAKQPERAAAWAATILDPELRQSTLIAVIGEWVQRDPAGARRFVQSNPRLSPADRAGLLNEAAGRDAHALTK